MKYNLFFLLGFMIVVSACVTPTQIENSWENPEVKKDTSRLFSKILFVAFLKEDAARRIAEDELVAQVKDRGVASYKYLNASDSRMDEKLLSDRLKRDGFDGIVIMRLAPADKQNPYTPGSFPSYYNNWYGYYSSTYPRYSDPGFYSASNQYHIETNVYSLTSDKLVWTGITTVVQTNDTRKMVDKVIVSVREQMRKQGLIK